MSRPIVQIVIRHVYGVARAYPLNDEAWKFATLVEMKTLSKEQLKLIESLGFTIEVVQPQYTDVLTG